MDNSVILFPAFEDVTAQDSTSQLTEGEPAALGPPPPSFSIQAVNSAGSPLGGIAFDLLDFRDDRKVLFSLITDSDGHAECDCPPGMYQLRYSVQSPFVPDKAFRFPCFAFPGEPSKVKVTLSPGASLSFRCKEYGIPPTPTVNNVNVRIFSSSLSENNRVSFSGHDLIQDIPPGRYKVTLEADGFVSRTIDVCLSEGENHVETVPLWKPSKVELYPIIFPAFPHYRPLLGGKYRIRDVKTNRYYPLIFDTVDSVMCHTTVYDPGLYSLEVVTHPDGYTNCTLLNDQATLSFFVGSGEISRNFLAY